MYLITSVWLILFVEEIKIKWNFKAVCSSQMYFDKCAMHLLSNAIIFFVLFIWLGSSLIIAQDDNSLIV